MLGDVDLREARRTLAAWHRAQRTFGSGRTAFFSTGSAAWPARGPWHASQRIPWWGPPFAASGTSEWHSTHAARPAKAIGRARLSSIAPAR